MAKNCPQVSVPQSLAFGATAWLATCAQGQIVTSTFSPIVTGPDSNLSTQNQDAATQYLTFNSTTGLLSTVADRPNFVAFRFAVADAAFGKFSSAQVGSWNGGYSVTSTRLTAGTTIGPSSTWTGQANLDFGDTNLTDVYRGIRLSDGAGNYRYGYITYSTGSALSGGSTYGPSVITITGAGFQLSLNTSIAAGATAVPEPASVAALAGLAAGAVAVRRLRKKAPAKAPA